MSLIFSAFTVEPMFNLSIHTCIRLFHIMYSTLRWNPQSDMDDLVERPDTLAPAEVKAKLKRFTDTGKICSCGQSKNFFQLVNKVPELMVSPQGISGRYCGFVSSESTDR